MHAQKLTISLSHQQCDFIESYQIEQHFKSRSVVHDKNVIVFPANAGIHFF